MITLISRKLAAAYHSGHRLALVFDYDGTLTPLADHPRLAHLDPALREVLAQLAARPRVTVGVVSGRALDNLIDTVKLDTLSYGGSTGLELQIDGKRRVTNEALESCALLDPLCATVEGSLADYPGAWVEKKPFGFTVHYRLLAVDRVEPLRTQTFSLLASHTDRLRLLDNPLAIEVLPAIGRDKGTALHSIVAHGGAEPATVLYAGDALNDEPALTATRALGGIALGIGLEAPAVAEYRLPDPMALHGLLATLAEEIA
ncbi:MAG: trehalose-phosphatase [Candidatus Competibacteraceae bacterium]|nr:trehalose-phosphatase [Candidatus Competibacteraceae bacterium]MCB1820075.1 trehalose-phosphatase [Candidatus Competibacteraceae bacterium]HRY15535.1 trehalose-phosphatase [Candidatus Competibacteraceae bacterium]